MALTDNDAGKAIVDRYLKGYQDGNLDAMFACLDENYTFSDPAFPDLDTARGKAMFRMFVLNRSTNKMALTYTPVEGSGDTYTSTYTVNYLFNGRPVTNPIHSTFTLSPASGLILKQVDDFDFWKWSQQSLGVSGLVLGWTPMLRNTVQGRAAQSLDKFIQKEAAGAAGAGPAATPAATEEPAAPPAAPAAL